MSKFIHIFGCSFSTGYGLNPEVSTIPYAYRKYNNNIWTIQIKNHLKGYETTSYALPGISNEVSKNLLLKNLNNIKEGDIVIFGLTDFKRLSILVDKNHPFNKAYFNITGRGYREYLENLMSKQPVVKFLPHYLKTFFKNNELDHSHFSSAINFYQEFIYKTKFAEQNEADYKEVLTSLTTFFDSIGVSMYVWDSSIWRDGENIATWSDMGYRDFHWSPNGNNFFLSYLLWGIENNYRFLNLELYNKFKKDIDIFSASKSLNTYIDHNPTTPII